MNTVKISLLLIAVLLNIRSISQSLSVNFDNGSYEPLILFYGPNDDPAQADTNYTVRIIDGIAHYIAPAAAPGPRLTGFLELPPALAPIAGDMIYEWTFTKVDDLFLLGTTTQIAVAGCYIRGGMNHWNGGLFGDYWFGYAYTGGIRMSVIRQGSANIQSEPFIATDSVSYRIVKIGDNILQLWAKYDNNNWHQVGATITITLNPATPGASYDVAVTHVRVLDLSGKAVDVSADTYLWTYGPAAHYEENPGPGSEFICFPNKNTQILTIRTTDNQAGFYRIFIYSSDGQLLKTQKFASEVDISGLSGGIYILMITDSENVLHHSQKFLL